MPHDDPLRTKGPQPPPLDEIEILEVVGVDETGAPVEGEAPGSEDVEVVFEEPRGGASEEGTARAEATVPRERLLRLQADFENYKKRIERERIDHLRHATGDLVARLLPVLDNLERATATARADAEDVAPFLAGVGLIQRQLLEELKREGLRPMDAVGAPFDPALHEAVATDSESAAPPHVVTQVLQRGYFFRDRVLRPALVRVRLDGTGEAGGAGGAGGEGEA